VSESSKQWVGQVVDEKFLLEQYLGGTDHSAVFLTHLREPASQAAIKVVLVDPGSAESQLARWRVAAKLSHPNLLRVFQSGRCELGGMELVYVVMEFAPEDLSQILPQRALTGEETREMLEPVLAALVYLHDNNLVHGHLKPANILALDDQVKLSSDALFPAGESRAVSRELDGYDAPEGATSEVFTAADVWSLGMSLVEVLTQSLPVRQDTLQMDPLLPQNLPDPFLEITRGALRLDAHRRWSAAKIAAYLNPKPLLAASAAAGAIAAAPSASPVSPSPVQAVPTARVPLPRLPAISREAPLKSSSAASGPRNLLPALAGALLVIALLAIPKFFRQRPADPGSVAVVPSHTIPRAPEARKSNPQQKAASSKKEPLAALPAPSAQAPAPSSLKTASEKKTVDRIPDSAASAPVPAPTASANIAAVSAGEKPASGSGAHGEVLDQVLPQISDKARATIHGKVRVAVNVQVDAAGNVAQAELDSPGPSRFFADLALQAARRWEFSSPEVAGRSVPSSWQLRFEFTQDGTKVFPQQRTP
jgi:TonB family protein